MADHQKQPVLALHWGVKQSFRGYVAMMGGVTEAGGGVEIAADGGFTFATAPDSDLAVGPDGSLSGQGRFLGEVRFEAHGGMLKVFLADPMLEIGASGASLTVADSAARTRRVEIAKSAPVPASWSPKDAISSYETYVHDRLACPLINHQHGLRLLFAASLVEFERTHAATVRNAKRLVVS